MIEPRRFAVEPCTTTAYKAWNVVNRDAGNAIYDGPIETEAQAEAVALFRNMEAGYVPSHVEIANCDWRLVSAWMKPDQD